MTNCLVYIPNFFKVKDVLTMLKKKIVLKLLIAFLESAEWQLNQSM